MRRIVVLVVMLALVLLAPASAAGAGDNFVATLSGDQEVPARDTQAVGVATFKLREDGTALQFKVNVDRPRGGAGRNGQRRHLRQRAHQRRRGAAEHRPGGLPRRGDPRPGPLGRTSGREEEGPTGPSSLFKVLRPDQVKAGS